MTTTSADTYDINELSFEQKIAFDKFKAGENLFITGPGGTGKTRLIKHFVQYAKRNAKTVDVCAMTGCAAILLECGAKTLHSWSGIRLAKGVPATIVTNVLKNRNAMNNWKKTTILILDEVSMLSKKIFEIIEEIGRRAKRSPRPFGGIQVVFTGDFYQLPPVPTEGEPDTELFCFESDKWPVVFRTENTIQLKTMFRQNDPLYIEILNQIRQGSLDQEKVEILKTYLNREMAEDCIATKLFPIRAKTDYVNRQFFANLKETEYIMELSEIKVTTYLQSGDNIDQTTLAQCARLSADELRYETEYMKTNLPITPLLRLKKGAVVMCTVNLDENICNGSQGVIVDFTETTHLPIVKFVNGITMPMNYHYWQSENIPTIAIGQIPLCLAWALTIHKIQGTTLNSAEIDIGHSIFEYGQTYVALSRVKSLEGLYLSDFKPEKIKANPKVIQFYSLLPVLTISPIKSVMDNETIKTIKTIRLV